MTQLAYYGTGYIPNHLRYAASLFISKLDPVPKSDIWSACWLAGMVEKSTDKAFRPMPITDSTSGAILFTRAKLLEVGTSKIPHEVST